VAFSVADFEDKKLTFAFRKVRGDARIALSVDAPELPAPLTFWYLVDEETGGLELVGFDVGRPIGNDDIDLMNETGMNHLLLTPALVRHITTHFHRYRRAAEAWFRNDEVGMVRARRPIIRGHDKWERMTEQSARSFLRQIQLWEGRGGITELAIELGVDRKTVYRRKARAEAILADANQR
jgi:hypothetical protein